MSPRPADAFARLDLGAEPRRSKAIDAGPRPGRLQGFSLIEVMIVILILALLVLGTGYAAGALGRTRLREAAMKVVSASRAGYNRAIIGGGTVRIAFDMEESTIALEEAPGFITLAAIDDSRRAAADEEAEDRAAVDPWEAARARLAEAYEPGLGRSPFGPIQDRQGHEMRRFRPRPIGEGVRISRIITPHEREPRESGKGAIYFFPGGMAEHAVVQLVDRDQNVYSVEIHPLTGRGEVHAYAFEPDDLLEEELDE
ncbi:MAG: prepilin-type N-terminal cleavage/methylation domain-containing protein [Myxococcales bacterium]|nr:prepilin-type N-terminal cleavage/methylation domain-containing protein [Myxococcales bacterium]